MVMLGGLAKVLRDVSIEVRRTCVNELKLLEPPLVDTDISQALLELVLDTKLNMRLRLAAAEALARCCGQAYLLSKGQEPAELSYGQLLRSAARRTRNIGAADKQRTQAEVDAERRGRDAARHCRACISCAGELVDTMRNVMDRESFPRVD
eukprot:COSAG01_NODE_1186_length_11341_cov_3.330635_16_plen_151_part_00